MDLIKETSHLLLMVDALLRVKLQPSQSVSKSQLVTLLIGGAMPTTKKSPEPNDVGKRLVSISGKAKPPKSDQGVIPVVTKTMVVW